jgi:cytochrome c oxidase subunit IV
MTRSLSSFPKSSGTWPTKLSQAWGVLIALSLGSALVTVLVLDRRIGGALVVGLALLKARVILSRYLGLDAAPRWRRGFNLTLGLFCAVLLGLFLI